MAQDTLLGFPAHTLHPQGVCSIRKAAEPLTAALPYRCRKFITLSTASAEPLKAAPLKVILQETMLTAHCPPRP